MRCNFFKGTRQIRFEIYCKYMNFLNFKFNYKVSYLNLFCCNSQNKKENLKISNKRVATV